MDVSQLEERIRTLELRVAYLENAQQFTPVSLSTTKQPTVASTDLALDKLNQGNWLGFIAVICFVMAAGFIVKLSIDTGWLTPQRQIALSFLFGLTLICTAFRLLFLDKGYASLLAASGIIILYLTTFAAHRFYFLITFQTAIIIVWLVSGICIWLYLKIKHDIFAITASIGTYLAPVILDLNTTTSFALLYFLICSCTYATISIWVKSRTLTFISAYLAILITSLVGLNLHQEGFIAIILALHFLIFAIGTYCYSENLREPLTASEAWSFFPILIIFYALEYFYIDKAFPSFAPWLSIVFAAILYGLYASAARWFPDRVLNSQALIMAFISVVFFHSVYLELLPAIMRPWLFVIIMLLVLFFTKQVTRYRQQPGFFVPSLVIFFILVIEYADMLIHLCNNASISWLLVSLASFISLWLVVISGNQALKKQEPGLLLLITAHVLGLSALYRLVDGSLAVSALWLFYGLAVMGLAFLRKNTIIAESALLILMVAAGKALLYDAASTPTIVRILCLMLTGIVLYGCGFLFKKITAWHS